MGLYWFNFCKFSTSNRIGGAAFWDCTGLTSVNFPLATTIDGGIYGAFEGCTSLTSVNFPLVTEIGGSAFKYCRNLSSVNFPLATTIDGGSFGGAFQGCINLTSIDIPLATKIGGGKYGAFEGCTSLTSVNFPLATRIGGSAFQNCRNLSSVNFPLATDIGGILREEGVFTGCTSLTSVTLGTGLTTPTGIFYWIAVSVFGSGDTLTKNIDLVLGENVLPKPDLDANIWQSDNYSNGTPYVWKSITIKAASILENNLISSIRIMPNPVTSEATIEINSAETQPNTIVSIIDLSGKEIINIYAGILDAGITNFALPNNLVNGNYFLLVKNKNGQKTHSFIVTK